MGISSLSGEWLAVAARGLDESHLMEILLMLTSSPQWSKPAAFTATPGKSQMASEPPYILERTALLRSIFGGMLKRKVDMPAFLQRLAANALFVTAVQSCAGHPQDGELIVFWLELSMQLAGRAAD